MRNVKVKYTNGDIINTSMSAHLTDADIYNYFRIGKSFNLGVVNDLISEVQEVVIK
tara:strand:+ start:1268 stop:1435 length:168 start_codon:yes stop_codon:yes gene_type:complete